MNNRLDFFNTVQEFSETLTDDDALLVISHNKTVGDAIVTLTGDWKIISALFSTEGYVKKTNNYKGTFDSIRQMILNVAYNICLNDEEFEKGFIEALTSSKETIIKNERHVSNNLTAEQADELIEMIDSSLSRSSKNPLFNLPTDIINKIEKRVIFNNESFEEIVLKALTNHLKED